MRTGIETLLDNQQSNLTAMNRIGESQVCFQVIEDLTHFLTLFIHIIDVLLLNFVLRF